MNQSAGPHKITHSMTTISLEDLLREHCLSVGAQRRGDFARRICESPKVADAREWLISHSLAESLESVLYIDATMRMARLHSVCMCADYIAHACVSDVLDERIAFALFAWCIIVHSGADTNGAAWYTQLRVDALHAMRVCASTSELASADWAPFIKELELALAPVMPQQVESAQATASVICTLFRTPRKAAVDYLVRTCARDAAQNDCDYPPDYWTIVHQACAEHAYARELACVHKRTSAKSTHTMTISQLFDACLHHGSQANQLMCIRELRWRFEMLTDDVVYTVFSPSASLVAQAFCANAVLHALHAQRGYTPIDESYSRAYGDDLCERAMTLYSCGGDKVYHLASSDFVVGLGDNALDQHDYLIPTMIRMPAIMDLLAGASNIEHAVTRLWDALHLATWRY